MKSRRGHWISWNLASVALLASVAAAAARQMPTAVTLAELDALPGGTFIGSGGLLATNPQSNGANKCYYCAPVGAPSTGSVKCTDNAQVRAAGPYSYTITPNVACDTEVRFFGANCTGKPGAISPNCTTTKTVYTDP